jgi:hypothetical protein
MSQPVIKPRKDTNAAEMQYIQFHSEISGLMKETKATFNDDVITTVLADIERYNKVVGDRIQLDDDFSVFMMKSFDAARGFYDNATAIRMPALYAIMPFDSGVTIAELLEQATTTNNNVALRILQLTRNAFVQTFAVNRVRHAQNSIKHLTYEGIPGRTQDAFLASYRTLEKYGRILLVSCSASDENSANQQFNELSEKFNELSEKLNEVTEKFDEIEGVMDEQITQQINKELQKPKYKGDKGDKGDKGKKGDKGNRGKKGDK